MLSCRSESRMGLLMSAGTGSLLYILDPGTLGKSFLITLDTDVLVLQLTGSWR